MKITEFDQKTNTLYIYTPAIMPKSKGWKEMKAAFAMSYEERIEKFASDKDKAEIKAALEEHKGCMISEFINA